MKNVLIEAQQQDETKIVASNGFYALYIKRFIDCLLSFLAIAVLSPLFLVLIVVGVLAMKGNPFFTQLRPGKNEKIFKIIKFRTMTSKKDKNGELLSDEDRLTKYGKCLRSTSLDELPELFNIFVGNMAIVGPRPLLVKYIDRYNERQHHRHDVRPGLTGLAQINGRNAISWEDRFELDIKYVTNITFFGDVKIVLSTILTVLKRKGISSETSVSMEEFTNETQEKEIITV